jgi:hypothetical protein
MSINHKIITTFQSGSESLSGTKSVNVEAEANLSTSVAVGANQLHAFALDLSQVKTLYLRASGGDLTLKTNSSGSPADTITLLDGEPLSWHSDADQQSPFASGTDVTALYITNAEAVAVLLDIRAGIDPTI